MDDAYDRFMSRVLQQPRLLTDKDVERAQQSILSFLHEVCGSTAQSVDQTSNEDLLYALDMRTPDGCRTERYIIAVLLDRLRRNGRFSSEARNG